MIYFHDMWETQKFCEAFIESSHAISNSRTDNKALVNMSSSSRENQWTLNTDESKQIGHMWQIWQFPVEGPIGGRQDYSPWNERR